MMKAMGPAARPMAAFAQAMGFGGGMPSTRADRRWREMPGACRAGRHARVPKDLPAACAGSAESARTYRLRRKPTLPGLVASRIGKKKENDLSPRHFRMVRRTSPESRDSGFALRPEDELNRYPIHTIRRTKCQSLFRFARAGTKKRPVYHVVVPISRFPRDAAHRTSGHFIRCCEGTRGAAEARHGQGKGLARQGRAAVGPLFAFPRCAGVRQARGAHNPEKAVPRKERKANAEAGRQVGVRFRDVVGLRAFETARLCVLLSMRSLIPRSGVFAAFSKDRTS